MELCVYAAHSVWVLVPQPCLPPVEAEQLFGPLRLVGHVRAEAGHRLWSGILAQIERHLFAAVTLDAGATLPGVVPADDPAY